MLSQPAYLRLRKNRTLLLLFVIFSSVSYSQDCDMTTRNMIKYLGTTIEDKANVVQRIGEHGYIVGGGKAIGSNNYLYLARLDLCGEVLWENVYSEGTYGYAASAILKDGFIYVSTYHNSPNKTALVKLDLDGNVTEAWRFGENATYPRRMIESSDGNFLISGATNASGGPGNSDFFLTKATPDGTVLWNRQIGGYYNDFSHNLMETSDGSIIVVGYARNYAAGLRRGIIMKFDSDGTFLWSNKYSNGANYTYVYFAIEVDGFYYFTGRGNNATLGGYDGYVMKTDTDGNPVWSKFIGTTNDDNMSGLAAKDGVLYVSGTAFSPTKSDEIVVLRMDYDGNLLDYTSLGSDNAESIAGAFNNFGVEGDGFFGVSAGNTGMIGNNDIIFYRFNSLADNCEPSDVELSVIDAGIEDVDFDPTPVIPTWTMSPVTLIPAAVPDNQGFICETLDSVACAPLITLISDTLVCDGDMVTLEATSTHGGTITWDGGVINGAEFTPPVGTTTYTATSDTTADCPFTVDITVSPLPDVVANADDTDICLGETVTFTGSGATSYVWNMGVTDGTPFEPLAVVTEMYTVTGTDADGCENMDSIAVTVHEIPVAHFEFIAEGVSSEIGATGGCIENDVQFNDLSTVGALETITGWNWDFGDSNTSADQNPTHNYASAGTYTVTLTVTTAEGCTATHSITIEMTGLELDITSVEPTCYGYTDGAVTGNISGATGSTTFEIKDEDGVTRNASGSNTANGLGTGWYYFTVTDDLGCETSGSVFLDQPDSLIAQFAFTPTTPKIDQEVLFTDLTEGAVSWSWDFGDGSGAYVENPRHTYTQPDTYTITLNVSDGNCSGIATATITVADNLVFYVPNAFTPDGDDHNATFQPVFTSGFDPYNYHLTIFNRWGEIIFESYNAANGWDGTRGNQGSVQEGVYVWQIEFGDAVTDDKYQQTGHVTILR